MAVYTIGPSRTERHSHTWHRVTRKEPCPICSDINWCEVCLDGCVHCMRTESSIKSDSRMGGYIHNLPDWRSTPPPINRPAKPKPEAPTELASLADRHRIYSDLLASCQLSAVHEAWLLGQGIDQPQGSYATLNGNRAEVCRHLMRSYPQELLITVPGLWIHDDGTLGIAAMDGLLVAVRGIDGRIERLQCRVETNGKKAYHWLSSSSHGGPSSGAIPHYADGPDKRRVYITEGVKKAEICALLTGHPCIGMASHSGYMAALEMVKRLDIDSVVVALDEDAKPETAGLVDKSRQELVQQALQRGLAVRVARWDGSLGKGIDDLLMAGHRPTITVARAVSDSRTDQNPLEAASSGFAIKARMCDDLVAIISSPLPDAEARGIAALRIAKDDKPAEMQQHYTSDLARYAGMHSASGAQKVGRALLDASHRGIVIRENNKDAAGHSHLSFALDMSRVPSATEIIMPSPRAAKAKDRDNRRRCSGCGKPGLLIVCPHCGLREPLEAASSGFEHDPTGGFIQPINKGRADSSSGLDTLPLDLGTADPPVASRVYRIGPATTLDEDPWTCAECGGRVWKESSDRPGLRCDQCGEGKKT